VIIFLNELFKLYKYIYTVYSIIYLFFSLEEGGATALGPALYYSILLASKKSGSQVILCTDGLANRGLKCF
jgi:hypothetical protein